MTQGGPPAETLIVPHRFRGPETSGNGGYTCGLIAARVDGDAQVILRRPPPLDRSLEVSRPDDRVLVHDGSHLIAEAGPAAWEIDVPEPPSLQEASAAAELYAGFRHHAFPTCFVCGTDRQPDDGLRVFPGPLPGRDLVAVSAITDASLPNASGVLNNEIIWSLLDCPGAWAVEREAENQPVVLGTMAARITRPIAIGTSLVVIGWPLGRDGRKLFSGTAVFAADGNLHGCARQTWIVIAAPA